MKTDDAFENWWSSKWKEREDLFNECFGETDPPKTVNAFYWDDIEICVPGGCALTFPPIAQRKEWLTISHGLTQPAGPDDLSNSQGFSGYGYEFGILTESKASWCTTALYQLITYLKQSGNPIDRGHRVPMWFSNEGNELSVHLGKPSSKDSPTGSVRAMLFWPHMSFSKGFSTSTGHFSVLIGTTITQSEWDIAKMSTSTHLLLLLADAGVHQVSTIHRQPVALDRWESIKSLSEVEASSELFKAFHVS